MYSFHIQIVLPIVLCSKTEYIKIRRVYANTAESRNQRELPAVERIFIAPNM